MKRFILAIVMSCAAFFPAYAQEGPLTGDQIKTALTDRTAFYDDGTKQFFSATGVTNYYDGNGVRDDGFWEVRGDQYCSWWERGGWACYNVTGTPATQEEARITFIAPNAGNRYPGYMVAGDKTSE